ncbi:MAG: N-6 DNA methylase, partial [Phycisphaerae bacterium]
MGVHYTPRPLADFVADRLVRRARYTHQAPLRILDPACGDGALLEALLIALQKAGMLHDCEVVGVEADARVVPDSESKLARFTQARCRLIPADFLDLATNRRGQAELWEPASADPAFECAFDIVIANPPYVRTQVLGAQKAQRLAARYSLTGRVDLYHAFIVAATEAMRPGGRIGIITSNRFLSTMGGSAVRGYLARNYEIEEVIDLGDTKLFEAAVLPAIFIGRRRRESSVQCVQKNARFIKIYSQPDRGGERSGRARRTTDIMEIVRQGKPGLHQTSEGLFKLTSGDLVIGRDPTKVWSLTTAKEAAWLRRVRNAAHRLFEDIAVVRVGIKTTADDVFIRSDWDTLPREVRPESDLLRPLLRHEDARRWSIPKAAQPAARALYPHEVSDGHRRPVDLDRYPRAKAYLGSHRERLEKRKYVLDAGRHWYEIWVPQNPDAWAAPKIVF